MRPAPPPNVPGETEAERFDFAVRKMFSVSKEDVVKEEARQKRAHTEKACEARLTGNQGNRSSRLWISAQPARKSSRVSRISSLMLKV
jgi:hypothetical protein